MKHLTNLNAFVLPILTLIALAVVDNASLYAHGILSKEIEPGKIGFSYDDGTPLANGYVSVYDKEGKEITTGQADSKGEFDYSIYENVGKISVADTHGHHRTHVIGAAQGEHAHDHSHDHSHDHHSGENTKVAIAVVAVLLAIAAVFYLGSRKKTGPPSE